MQFFIKVKNDTLPCGRCTSFVCSLGEPEIHVQGFRLSGTIRFTGFNISSSSNTTHGQSKFMDMKAPQIIKTYRSNLNGQMP